MRPTDRLSWQFETTSMRPPRVVPEATNGARPKSDVQK